MTEKTALSMLDEALRAQGYGGLVRPEDQCGCEVGDLATCGSDFASCRPGYKHTDPRARPAEHLADLCEHGAAESWRI